MTSHRAGAHRAGGHRVFGVFLTLWAVGGLVVLVMLAQVTR